MSTFLPLLGSLVVVLGFLPYTVKTVKKQIKPRLATFITWNLITISSTIVAIISKAYASALITGTLTIMQMMVLYFVIKNGDRAYGWVDGISQLISCAGIVAWLLSKNPLYAIVFNIMADIFGYVPTFYHAWIAPYDETWLSWLIVSSGAGIILLGARGSVLINILFPLYLFIINASLGLTILFRQKSIHEILD